MNTFVNTFVNTVIKSLFSALIQRFRFGLALLVAVFASVIAAQSHLLTTTNYSIPLHIFSEFSERLDDTRYDSQYSVVPPYQKLTFNNRYQLLLPLTRQLQNNPAPVALKKGKDIPLNDLVQYVGFGCLALLSALIVNHRLHALLTFFHVPGWRCSHLLYRFIQTR